MACRRPGRSPWGRCKYYPPSVARYGVNSDNNVFRRAGGTKPHLYRPAAIMLRSYQLDGVYIPGPALVTLPVAGALDATATVQHARQPRAARKGRIEGYGGSER